MIPKEESIYNTLSDHLGDPQGILGEFSSQSVWGVLPLNLCYKLYSVQTLGSGSSSQQKRVHPVAWSRGAGNTIT